MFACADSADLPLGLMRRLFGALPHSSPLLHPQLPPGAAQQGPQHAQHAQQVTQQAQHAQRQGGQAGGMSGGPGRLPHGPHGAMPRHSLCPIGVHELLLGLETATQTATHATHAAAGGQLSAAGLQALASLNAPQAGSLADTALQELVTSHLLEGGWGARDSQSVNKVSQRLFYSHSSL